MNLLITDVTIHGLIAEKFAYTKEGFIRDLQIKHGGAGDTKFPLPCFNYNNEEVVYGLWTVVEYIDSKFGPDRRLIPQDSPFERATVMSFCQYHLTKEVLAPIHASKDINTAFAALERICRHLGHNTLSFKGHLSIIDVFLSAILECIPAYTTRKIPKTLANHKRFIDEQIEQFRQSTARHWDISDSSEHRHFGFDSGSAQRPVTAGTLV